MKLLLKCPLCKTRRTSSSRCWKCKQRAPESARVYGNPNATRKPAMVRKQDVARSENQERKEDEAANRLSIGSVMELQPCHRCGRAVLVQVIPMEERKQLGKLPVAVECESPCAKVETKSTSTRYSST